MRAHREIPGVTEKATKVFYRNIDITVESKGTLSPGRSRGLQASQQSSCGHVQVGDTIVTPRKEGRAGKLPGA